MYSENLKSEYWRLTQQPKPRTDSIYREDKKKKPKDGEKIMIGGLEFNIKKKKKQSKKEEQIMTSNGALLKPGRHPCDCEGKLHKLLTNCLNCGKILCEQEGYGKCFFCGNQVDAPSKDLDINLQKAMEHRNKLLEYDQNYEKRTMVVDDQTEYNESETNQWLTEKEKEERKKLEKLLMKLKEDEKKRITLNIDFAGRKVEMKDETKKEIESIMNQLKTSSFKEEINTRIVANPKFKVKYKGDGRRISKKENRKIDGDESRIQHSYSFHDDSYHDDSYDNDDKLENDDKLNNNELNDIEIILKNNTYHQISIKDEGKCLSMHQPWASLVIYGIKKHEGRNWYSDHRGRLWIASTQQEPSPELIKQVEDEYRKLGRTWFPKYYPTSALLGCVDVENVWSQEEYQKKCKDEEKESESEYVFILKNPRPLIVPFTISGKPKIYKLEKSILESAQKGLVEIPPEYQS